MSRFVVAARTGMDVNAASLGSLKHDPRVKVVRTSSRGRMVVEMDSRAFKELKDKFDSQLIIEPEIMHTTLDARI